MTRLRLAVEDADMVGDEAAGKVGALSH